MELLQVTILFLLPSLCSSDVNTDVINASTSLPIVSTTIKTSVLTPSTESLWNPVITPTMGTTPKGTTNSELSTVASLTTSKEDLGITTTDGRQNESIISNAAVTYLALPTAVSTLQSSQHKTETQSTIKTMELSGNTLQPDVSPSKTGTLHSTPVTIPESTLQSQGTENGKNASASATSPSYSSIILPVVIALIVITLSVFVLVGLYRVCWKSDPGTAENGNDQPQSDKESVKLLTVKTISHESGEHSAQGKSKN
ncbi:endomucin isoform X1 [Aotus nancymaae]|uniref:Endomucin n=1 Tax=Aotus nancymaae TaxID=37293 RepID=A0A2K5F4P6_AOTNA|nr:endomucin isoform X1 [Aotus nancymaae]XP_012291969.1 endomucin isoform X1 [Aotus nancymaae]XP_012291970.1 endomucin isoform X1 [Aotus nancymaae]XP_012291971.1 endomucin isoform X1 [Aotus nancymaae]XP_012291972.1 endomucin isoform X1 [Aotus nancymaae]XP_012291973.1 endomucin isoform X1 [Aotus nancymaae]XP_012291975.1 endomucin isoform X1 [Aotus nancymaae]